MTVFPLLSMLLRGHQALDRLSLALVEEYDEGQQFKIEGNDDCGPVMLVLLCLF